MDREEMSNFYQEVYEQFRDSCRSQEMMDVMAIARSLHEERRFDKQPGWTKEGFLQERLAERNNCIYRLEAEIEDLKQRLIENETSAEIVCDPVYWSRLKEMLATQRRCIITISIAGLIGYVLFFANLLVR